MTSKLLEAEAYFERVSPNSFRPTVHAGGAWSPGEIHFSPLGGLVVSAIEQYAADRLAAGMVFGRISFDILGFLATDVCEVRVETLRPGRTIELIGATVLIGGRPVVLARVWLLGAFDTALVAGGAHAPLSSPAEAEYLAFADVWTGGYIASIEARATVTPEPGRGTVWLSTSKQLVAGEPAGPVASWVTLIDTANGIAVRQAPTEWIFPNVDLTIHLFRQPTGAWTGLDTTVIFGPTGQGVTSTVLHDETGPVGYANQALTIRPAVSGG